MQPYQTIRQTAAAPAVASVAEKKSEFIAAAAHVQTEEEAVAFLEQVRARHRTARHNVYAYLLRADGRTRYSDDGEPAKTAGLPVLEVLQHAGLTDVACVVTRYFGGILLGTGGLVRAYTQAAQAALAAAAVVTVTPCVRMTVGLAYPLYERACLLVEASGARTENTEYGADVTLQLLMPDGLQAALSAQLTELSRGQARIAVSEAFYTAF